MPRGGHVFKRTGALLVAVAPLLAYWRGNSLCPAPPRRVVPLCRGGPYPSAAAGGAGRRSGASHAPAPLCPGTPAVSWRARRGTAARAHRPGAVSRAAECGVCRSLGWRWQWHAAVGGRANGP